MKGFIAVLATMALFVFAALAMATPPGNDDGLPGCKPSHNTPKKCHDGSVVMPGFVFVTEPPGVNCPAGGVKIIKLNGPGAADDQVFYVCNGVAGPPGPPGAPGAPGLPGGLTFQQLLALIAALPVATPNGPVTVNNTITLPNTPNVGARCRSTRARARMVLPRRFNRFRVVVVRVDDGVNRLRLVRRSLGRRYVRVNMFGRRCGVHIVVGKRRGVRPTVRLWTVTSRRGITRQTIQF